MKYHVAFHTFLSKRPGIPYKLFPVRFEVLTAVSMKIAVFWVGDRPDDGGSKDL
jgi:hypothetical protein